MQAIRVAPAAEMQRSRKLYSQRQAGRQAGSAANFAVHWTLVLERWVADRGQGWPFTRTRISQTSEMLRWPTGSLASAFVRCPAFQFFARWPIFARNRPTRSLHISRIAVFESHAQSTEALLHSSLAISRQDCCTVSVHFKRRWISIQP